MTAHMMTRATLHDMHDGQTYQTIQAPSGSENVELRQQAMHSCSGWSWLLHKEARLLTPFPPILPHLAPQGTCVLRGAIGGAAL